MKGILAQFALEVFDKWEELGALASGQLLDILKSDLTLFGHAFRVHIGLEKK